MDTRTPFDAIIVTTTAAPPNVDQFALGGRLVIHRQQLQIIVRGKNAMTSETINSASCR